MKRKQIRVTVEFAVWIRPDETTNKKSDQCKLAIENLKACLEGQVDFVSSGQELIRDGNIIDDKLPAIIVRAIK